MKRIYKIFVCVSIFCFLITTSGCMGNGNVNTDRISYKIAVDMQQVSSVVRNLDNIYLEDYTITELYPIVGYNTYNSQTSNYRGYNSVFKGNSDEDKNVASIIDSGEANDFIFNFSYQPKYIDDDSNLNTAYLLTYLQSMQDLFLIISDITAANYIFTELTYSVMNKAIEIRNNTYLLDYNTAIMTNEQLACLEEYSVTLNNILINLSNTNGNINLEMNNLNDLRTNFYKNAEILNAKYLNILNILDSRIIQLENINTVLERINTQILLITNSTINSIYGNSDLNDIRNNYNDGLYNNYANNRTANGLINNQINDNIGNTFPSTENIDDNSYTNYNQNKNYDLDDYLTGNNIDYKGIDIYSN